MPKGAFVDLIRQLDLHREAALRSGRPARPVLRRDIDVGESDEEARAVVGSILAEGYRGTGLDQLLVGRADTVVHEMERYRRLGFDAPDPPDLDAGGQSHESIRQRHRAPGPASRG
jgi:alkanesulfonate monooxygenase SsuD/methylene tetrahydromethanopterin reductase-like flavin-dependent oxidoreductase (luciferase family)